MHCKHMLRAAAVAALFSAVLAGCGGGGNDEPAPPPPAQPTVNISAYAGVDGANGNVDGPLASAQFNQPAGIATDSNGNLYIADNQNFTIRKIGAGVVSTIAGVPGQTGSSDGATNVALFAGPENIRVDGLGNLYVTDQGAAGNPVIRMIGTTGQVTTLTDPATSLAIQTNGSPAIAVDSARNLYVFTTAPDGSNVLTRIVPGGSPTPITLQAGNGSPVGLINPQDIVIDAANNLYIADTNLNQGAGAIYRVTISGTTGAVTTLAGSTAVAGSADGIGAAAQFDGLLNLAIDPSDNLYANDFDNGTARLISPAGVVSTVAGTPDNYGLSLGPVPGTLPDIGGIVWLGGSLYLTDYDDNLILQIGPLP